MRTDTVLARQLLIVSLLCSSSQFQLKLSMAWLSHFTASFLHKRAKAERTFAVRVRRLPIHMAIFRVMGFKKQVCDYL